MAWGLLTCREPVAAPALAHLGRESAVETYRRFLGQIAGHEALVERWAQSLLGPGEPLRPLL